MRQQPTRAPILIAGILPAVAATAAAVLYDEPLTMLAAVLAAAAAGAAPVAFSRRSLRAPVALGLLAAVLALIAFAVRPSSTSPVAEALTGSLARLLSYAPPIPTGLDTLAVPVVVVWAAAFTAATLAAGGRALLSCLPSVLVLVAAVVLTGETAPIPGWVAPAVVVGVALTLIAAQRRPAAAPTWRTRLGGPVTAITVTAAMTVAGLAVAEFGDTGERADARGRYHPPQERPQPIDPLTRLSAWARGGAVALADVDLRRIGPVTGSVTGPVTGQDGVGAPSAQRPVPWRWAVLESFDGARWTSAQEFRQTGGRLRLLGSDQVPLTRAVEATVRVQSPELAPWLPSPGRLTRVDGLAIAVDADQVNAIAAKGGPGRLEYTVGARSAAVDPLDPADRALIEQLNVGSPGGAADALAVPDAPEALTELAGSFAGTPGETDGARALRLQDALRKGSFATDAAPGHLYLRLAQFFDETSPGYLRGTSEQFATAFAVLARSVGLPTRIVVGFVTPPEPGDTAITPALVRAWPEVYFEQGGWVRFDPTPEADPTAKRREPPELDTLFPQDSSPAQAEPTAKPEPSTSGRDTTTGTSTSSGLLPVLGRGGAALLGLLLLVAVVLVAVRWRRRRARRSGSPAEVVLGAWLELEDALRLSGSGPLPGTARQVAQRAAQRLSAPSSVASSSTATSTSTAIAVREELSELAAEASRVAFGPARQVDPDRGERAWRVSTGAVRALRRRSGWWRRATWWVRPLR